MRFVKNALWTLGAALLVFTGCTASQPQPESAPQPGTPLSATDDWSRPVRLPNSPGRVVVIGPGATEIVFALGAGNRIVGRDSGSNYPAAASKIPVVADFRGPFFESVRAARPDFILVQGETFDKSRLDSWQTKCDAPVAGLAATDLAAVQQSVEKVARWLQVDEAKKATVRQTITIAPLPQWGSAFLEVQRRPLMTAGEGTLVGDAMKRAGLSNVTNTRGYKTFSVETLATLNPRFYVVSGDVARRAQIVAELQQTPGLKNLACVREGRVLVVNGDLLFRPGPRLADGIRQLAEAASKFK